MIALENLQKIRRTIKNGGDDQTRTRDLCRDSARKRIRKEGVALQPLFFVATVRHSPAHHGTQRKEKHKN
jgi:hypothetical protein